MKINGCFLPQFTRLETHSHSKINLFLDVGNLRPDGYHEVRTLLQEIELGDRLTIDISSSPVLNSLSKQPYSVSTEYIGMEPPPPEMDLVRRCLEAYLEQHKWPDIEKTRLHISVKIEKTVPPGAGLGGGSGDAIAALKTVASFIHGKNISNRELESAARQAGADAPFFLRGGTALATGRGDILTPAPSPVTSFGILVVWPAFQVRTGEAYSWLAGERKNSSVRESAVAFSPANFRIPEDLYNSFEKIIFKKYPVLQEIKSLLIKNGARGSLMSGSGSSIYGLFNDTSALRKAAEILEARGFKVFETVPLEGSQGR